MRRRRWWTAWGLIAAGCILAFGFGLTSWAATESSPQATLLASWGFDGSLDDGSGNAYHLSQLGSNLYYSAGCLDQALHFDWDVGSYLSRETDDPAFDFGTGDYSVELWLNFDRIPSRFGEQTLIEKCGGEGCGTSGWGLTVMDNNTVRFIQNDGSHQMLDSPPLDFRVGRWYHLVAVRNGTSSYLYLDGEEVASGPAFDLLDTDNPLIVGRRFDEGQQFPFTGFLDGVTIHDGALSATEVLARYQAGATCQALPVPLRIFVYDDYEESGYEGSLREFLEARGHTVTYTHDDVGDIDVWQDYSAYDAILAIHTCGGGTLTNLDTWFQNGRGYVAMLGGDMWNDEGDGYIRDLLGVNQSGEVGEGWTPDQLFWADASHPITNTPHAGWDLTGLPYGQNQYYVEIVDGYTVVSGPDGAVLQTREGVEGTGRLALFGSNYHDEERSDPEARYLAENLVTWASDPQPATWFDPGTSDLRGSAGTVVTHTLSLVNRTGQEATFDLSASGNAWPTSLDATVGPVADGGRAEVVVAVEVPSGASTDDQDTVVIEAQAQHDPALVGTAALYTSAPGPARQIELTTEAYQVAVSGSTVVTATVTDRDGLPVVDGTAVDFAVVAGGTLSPESATTTNGQATTTFTGVTDCALAEIEATSGEGWAPAYVSVGGSGPTDVPGGEIALDTTWAACDGPFLVHGDVVISSTAALTVAAGSQVRFDWGTGLVIRGELLAPGQGDAPVLFTANSSPAYPGFWKGLILGDALHTASGLLDHVVVSYAGQWHTWGEAATVLAADQADPRVQPQGENPRLEMAELDQGRTDFGAGILVYHGAPTVQNSLIWRNQGNGLWAAAYSLPVLADNRVLENEGGIAVESANVAAVDTPIPSGEDADVEWRYLAFEEPAPGWNNDPGFDDAGWSAGLAPIGDGGNWKTYLDLEGATMYARKIVTPADPVGTTYYLRVSRDDEASVWLNGTLILSDTQGGGAQWTSYVAVTLDVGTNLVAVEMRDSGAGANYFDLELTGGTFQQATVRGNTVLGNGSNGWAGIYIGGSSPLVEGNEVAHNGADGVRVAGYGWPWIRNNRFHHNGDAGLRLDGNYPGGWPVIHNNVLDSNGSYGLAWDNWWGAQPDIQNNVVSRNVRGLACQETRYHEVTYNDVWANGGDYWGCSEEVSWNNQSVDPFYLDPDGADYHLQLGSPVFDAGNPDPAFNDLDGSRNDMGAYGGPGGETYTYVDVRGPWVKWAMAEPGTVAPGETVTLTVAILDPSGVAWANAEVESPDETVIDTLTLYDDGAHGDNLPGDDVYGAVWVAPAGDHEYLVDILSEDGLGQASADDNVAGFSTHEPLTLTVINTDDSGPGSLRQALLDAQYGDTVDFDPTVFPPGSPATVFVTSGQLPDLDDGHVTVDASTAGVILDGSGLPGDGEDGLGVTGEGNIILGLQITGFPGDGLELQSAGNVVGGTTEAERNVLAGNGQNGLRLNGAGATGNVVQGNYIGVDATGLGALPNVEHGIAIQEGARGNLIGGENAGEGSPTAGNLIFASGQAGVNLWGEGTAENTIRGNWIGFNALGTAQQAFPSDLAISPAYDIDCTLYVATLSSGVHMSTDCGATWTEMNNGLTESRLLQVEIPPDAGDASTAYVLAENGYLFVTADGGANWSLVSTVLEGIDRRNLVLSAGFGSDGTMYASAQDWSSGELGGGPGAFKSTDGGVTWSRQVSGMSDEQVAKVIASPDPAAKDTLFTLNWQTLQKSTDGGATWSTLPAPDNNLSDLALSPDYATDQTVFLTSDNGRIYRSTDGGETWTGVDALRGDPRFLAVSPAYATDQTVCHGAGWNDQLYCSTDGGMSWSQSSTGLPGSLNAGGTGVAFSPAYASDATFLVASAAGVSASTDGGASWALLRSLRDLGGQAGVEIGNGASHNTVGPDNVLSNNHFGVTITDFTSAYNAIAGNLVGTDPTGMWALSNSEDGIAIWGGYHNMIGGSTPAEGNVVSGAVWGEAVRLNGGEVLSNTVSGNYIGTDVTGSSVIGNAWSGVILRGGARGNLIGGDEPGERNVISGNGSGVGLGGDAHDNTISGNYIGLNAAGSAALGNRSEGVGIWDAANNTIGGETPGERNVISGNGNVGVGLWSSAAPTFNTIVGNYIGTDATGSYAVGNDLDGVMINGSGYNSLLDNVISGNHGGGLQICCTADSSYNVIQGNRVGTDATGTYAVMNEVEGISINYGAHDNLIGGTGPGEGNLISGNRLRGIILWEGAASNTIAGNLIGTDAGGTQPLSNGTGGMLIDGGSTGNTVGPSNTIAFNAGHGVRVKRSDTLNNTITRNSIHHNDGPGITLSDGGNGGLPAPRIESVDLGAGTVAGTACPGCNVEVFSSDDEEGRTFEGHATADGSGNFSWAKGAPLEGPYVRATATDGAGNTSAFSPEFRLLVFDLGVPQIFEALDNLGLTYDVVDGAGFATVDLGAYDVLFVGFTGNDPQPDDLLLPLLDRQADITAFVVAGGGLVANSEDGVVATPLDWQWVPVDVTHRNSQADQMEIAQPAHLLVQGLTEALLAWWSPMHNVFEAWDWPEAEAVLVHPDSGEAVVLAGSYGAGRMVLSGSDPDYHSGTEGPDRLLYNELYWAAGALVDTPPQVVAVVPEPGSEAASRAIVEAGFDQLLDPATVDASTVSAEGSLSGAIVGSVTYYTRTASLAFESATDLPVGEVVTVTISGSIQDASGLGLDGDGDGVSEGSPGDDYLWSFTVREGQTLVVTDPGDGGLDAAGPASGLTLRQALEQALPGDTITFDPAVFPPGSPATIFVTNGQLPDLDDGYVTVDASDAGVILDGSGLPGDGEDGLGVTGEGNIILGLQITGFPGDGLELQSRGNVVGGTTEAERNVLAGNRQNGLRLNGPGATGNVVQGNYIGVDATGLGALPNVEHGIAIQDGASGNLIGGENAGEGSPTAGNLIFANGQSGVNLWGDGTADNTIRGNWIGLNASGTARQAFPTDLAVSPVYDSDCTLYVATLSTGVHMSTDCGATWSEVNDGLTESRLLQVEIPPDAGHAGTAYALADNGYLFWTIDGGASWSLVSTALEGIDRRNLALSASFGSDGTMYAAASNWAWWEMGGGPGVFKSTDGGLTWTRQVNGMSDEQVGKVVASPDPAAKDTLFTLNGQTVQKSTDGGATWSTLPAPGENLGDLALSPDYATDHTVFVTSRDGWVYRSTDGGENWIGVEALRGDPHNLAVSPAYATDQTVCHGGGWNDWIYCSTDGGETWNATSTHLPGPLNDVGTGIAFSPAYPAYPAIFVLSVSGLSLSTDGGANWQLARGLRDLGNVQGVALGGGASHNIVGPGNLISNNDLGVTFNDDGTAYNVVAGNLFGTGADGTSLLGSPEHAVALWGGHHNLIGGDTPEARNIINGSLSGGAVWLHDPGVTANTVSGNYIGLDASGTAVVGNGDVGVGLRNGASGNVIGGDEPGERNVISGNGMQGVGLWDASTTGNLIQGNFVGTDASGTVALGNGNEGIHLHGPQANQILDNLVSANQGSGVGLCCSTETSYNVIQGNRIGTDVSGSYALPNNAAGISLSGGASHNLVGGPGPGQGNLVSGNGDRGIVIWNLDTSYNVIQGNYVGTDASGTAALANRYDGVQLVDSHHNTIGGTGPGEGNLISGNEENGVTLWGSEAGAAFNVIEGNLIGTNATGSGPLAGSTQPLTGAADPAAADQVLSGPASLPLACVRQRDAVDDDTGLLALAALPSPLLECAALNEPSSQTVTDDEEQVQAASNGQHGIYLRDGAHQNIVGAGNTIAFNAGDGVYVEGGGTLSNTITANSLFHNGGLGIRLVWGGNAELAAPRVQSVDLGAGTVTGTACPGCRVEIFSADDEEGRTFEGETVADGSGYFSFAKGSPLAGPNVTATATDADGNTSAFSSLFNLLVYDLGVGQTFEALGNLGLSYDVVDAAGFASVDLGTYDVLFVGFTGNDPQPDDVLQPLLDRRADIAAFVAAGGGLVANSEDGVVATPLDWQWVPVDITHRNSYADQIEIAQPAHLLAQGLTEALLAWWFPMHNVFEAWDWPEAQVVLARPGTGEAVVLAGSYGSGRMVLSGSDPDYHSGDPGAELLLTNELYWAAGVMADTPPQVVAVVPEPGSETATRAIFEATFDQLLDQFTVHAPTVSAEGSLSGPLVGWVTYYTRTAEVVFEPASDLLVGEVVTVTLSGNIEDASGLGLDGDGDGLPEGSPEDDYVWRFTVREGQSLLVTEAGDAQLDAAGPASGLTLRQALEQAQVGDTIAFDPAVFPPGSPVTIHLTGDPLPELWQGYVTLDASSAGVILDGSGLNWGPGLRITSDGNVVRGLQILHAPEDGLQLDGGASQNVIGGTAPAPGGPCTGDCNLISSNGGNGIWVGGASSRYNTIQGNYVGTDVAGTASLGNTYNGVSIQDAPFTWVEANLLSANCTSGDWCDGLGIYGPGAVWSVVYGNLIGVDASGLNPLGNQGSGITIAYGASHNRIGGATAARRNVVSANQNGIELVHDYTADNIIQGNYIGTDASGLNGLGNEWEGISLGDSTGTRVGGMAPGEGNVIAANGGDGLNGQSADAWIGGNSVGTDATGLGALGNGRSGIVLFSTEGTAIEANLVANNFRGIRVSGSNNALRENQIGVDAAGYPSGYQEWGLAIIGYQSDSGLVDSSDNWVEGNVLAHNGQGVLIYEAGGARVEGNRLTRNSIYGSSGLPWLYNLADGISLYGNANLNLAPPVITTFNLAAGTASGTACAGCTVEVFGDDDDEGRWYEGTAVADGAGTWSFDKGSAFTGANVHATATDAAGNSSEFSGPPPIVSSVSPTSTIPGTANLGVLISGDLFRDNEPLTVGFGDGINVTSVEFQAAEQIKVFLDVDGGAALGPRDVTVTNYDGQSDTLPAGFEVVPVPPPPPTVTGVVPDQIAPGASGNVRIYGTGFIDRPAVAFGGSGVTVDAVTFDDPTRLTVYVSVDPGASLGPRDVTVTNPDGQAGILAAGLNVVPPRFEEVGAAAGVDDTGDGLGVAWGDYDGDGDQDLYVAQGGATGGEADILYQNQGDGTFADVGLAAGLGDEGPARAAVWGDCDNDGDLDLYVTRYGQANLLYANNGDGTFSEGAAAAGVDRAGDSNGAAWADYDLDGHLDLFVVGESSPNALYRNNGDCTFDDVTGEAQVAQVGSGREGVAWGDYDDDGDPDLYLADNGGPNQLYRNNGDGTFTQVGASAGVDDTRFSRGVAWGDYDNDGDLDLVVANHGDTDAVYRNNGDGTFADVAAQAGMEEPANSTGVSLGDFDNDGDLDIWVMSAGGANVLYLNRGDGTFMPDLEPALLHEGNAHGGAAADYDNDGDLDLYLTNRDDGNPNLLYRNGTDASMLHAPTAAPHWLQVRLVGTLSNARAIGARVRVVAGGLSQVREISGGSGFWSQDSLLAEFGLGTHADPVTVEVTWPSGVVDTLPGVAVDQVLTVVESTPYLHNMAVASVAPDGEQPAGVPFPPVVTVRNLGQLAETGVPVTCRIEHGGSQVYLETVPTGLMAPGAWATLVLPAFTPTDTGDHLLTCWVTLPGDENPTDDELARELLVTQQVADAWTKDNPADDGDVPSSLNDWYGSPDLWVRHAPDGGLIHQDPVAGVENTVYVRIRNRGNTPVYEGTVSVYWIEPSLGVRCGDWAWIATIPFTNLLPSEVRIVSTPWVPTRTGHTCLQDVIDSPQDPYDRGLECAPQWVPWDNNVEWRNINVYSNPGGVRAGLLDVKDAEVQLVNVYDRPEAVDMIVERQTFPLSGDVVVRLPAALFDRWLAYGRHWGEGIEVLAGTKEIRVTGEISATIGAIPMQAGEQVTVGLHFEGPAGLAFELATRERIGGLTTGGVGYQWVIPDTTPPEVVETVPAGGATGVILDAPLVITFSEQIGPLTLELVLDPDPGEWNLAWNEAGTVVTATHAAFVEGTTYQATVTASDAAGNPMSSAETWAFTAASDQYEIYLPLILRR